ncbi:MAG TPA: hypothetical protein VMT87_05415 [Vicinamibacteria bacterium]|nr:hypothetical protein [Vicinamibacteria bacterium]
MSAASPPAGAGLTRHLLLPVVLLTVALLGGLRVQPDQSFVFVAPPLVALVMALLLMSLFARGGLIRLDRWLSERHTPLANASHALTLLTLFAASAQAFNSVLPERGLLHWVFALFFLWTLWNDQFAPFDPRRLLRSLSVLFGTAFVLKHLLLASLYTPQVGWGRRLMGALLEGASLGTLDVPVFAPATGYVSFLTLALYVGALTLVRPAPDDDGDVRRLLADYRRLSPVERALLRDALDDRSERPVRGRLT